MICGADDQLPQPNSSMSISSRAATASIASKSVSGRLSVIIPIFMVALWQVGEAPRSAAERETVSHCATAMHEHGRVAESEWGGRGRRGAAVFMRCVPMP